MLITINKATINKNGNLKDSYKALPNTLSGSFNTDKFKLTSHNTLDIDCQPSYDGSVNLLVNDAKNPIRLINTRFSKVADNKFEIPDNANINYDENFINEQTNLYRTSKVLPRILLDDIVESGNLFGGNYTIYIKYSDFDNNETPIIAESGIISIFNGSFTDNASSIQGTLMDERTNKAIRLKITNIDNSFYGLSVIIRRATSDLNGIPLYKTYKLAKPIIIKDNKKNNDVVFTITGNEEIEEVANEEINIQYNIYDSEKTFAQVQNMLFIGNVTEKNLFDKTLYEGSLNNISLYAVQDQNDFIRAVNYNYTDNRENSSSIPYTGEYYNPKNIYYRLGY